MQELIQLAEYLADEAGTVIERHFRKGFKIETKEDETPVTVADRGVEQRLREIVEMHRPEDGILGEEFGPKDSRNSYTWVFDPIDGTKSFIIGRPTFGTLIALCENDIPVLGVIDQPISKERWIGAKGQPTLFNGKAVKTRPCTDLKSACVASTSPSQMPHLWQPMYEAFGPVVWGGDCYSYGLLSNGWLDVVIESGLSTYDFAALPPIVEGAGGLMCDWQGNPLTLTSDGNIIAIGDPYLKNSVLNFLS